MQAIQSGRELYPDLGLAEGVSRCSRGVRGDYIKLFHFGALLSAFHHHLYPCVRSCQWSEGGKWFRRVTELTSYRTLLWNSLLCGSSHFLHHLRWFSFGVAKSCDNEANILSSLTKVFCLALDLAELYIMALPAHAKVGALLVCPPGSPFYGFSARPHCIFTYLNMVKLWLFLLRSLLGWHLLTV